MTARSNLVDFVVPVVETENMTRKTTDANEYSYAVPGWYWDKNRATAIRSARVAGRKRRKKVDGEPVVHVILVWPQEQAAASVA